MAEPLDCLVIGGGPAGLTACIYLTRFRRHVQVIDSGNSRAMWIPRSHNLPGFPDGVEGSALLDRMREQARSYGGYIRSGGVTGLSRTADGVFCADLDGDRLWARTVILATGVLENEPRLPDVFGAVKRGLIRTCPICDAYEAIDKRIAVLGNSEHAAAEALFLRTYTADVTLVLVGDGPQLSDKVLQALSEAGVHINHTRIDAVDVEDSSVVALCSEDGVRRPFDVLYSAFGTTPQSALADLLNAALDECGRLTVSDHQETSIDGLYAAGDLVRSLNQISVANGEAAIAATAIHNRLPRKNA